MQPSDSETAKVAEGVTTALVKLTAEQIKDLIFRFQNKDVAFIEDKGIILRIKAQRDTPSWKFYETYIKDPDLRIQIQLGLTLRGYTKNNDKVNIEKLRDKIHKKYSIEGLHIAEYVSSNVLSKYIITLIDTNDSIQNITKKVTEILKNIERDVIFLTNQDNAETEANIIQQRINVNVPNSLIITSSRGAIRIHEDVLRLLGEKINSNYKMQSTYDTQENPIEMITFINKTS
jgi:hypothetical protein